MQSRGRTASKAPSSVNENIEVSIGESERFSVLVTIRVLLFEVYSYEER